MSSTIECLVLPPEGNCSEDFGTAAALGSLEFHKNVPGYEPTKLSDLKALSKKLGVENFWIKDESSRFGLNAFKVLGGSFCLFKVICELLGLDSNRHSFKDLQAPEVAQTISKMTFITATDGNHGRGIAWSAKKLGAKCVVLMPKGSSSERLENIQKLGADAWITDVNYDATVAMAADMAEKNGWTLVQDTSWDGYEEIPTYIMQGYLTMAKEAQEQLGEEVPTHVFLQAGVGSMAGAVASFLKSAYGERAPEIVVVEPFSADCIYKTAAADDGELKVVEGDLKTIMAGLACGKPCTLGWKELRACASAYLRIQESVAATGVRVLSSPLEEDPRILAGESGAAPIGAVIALLADPNLSEIKNKLQLNKSSKILCFLTEGVTDRKSFLEIVWEGKYPSEI